MKKTILFYLLSSILFLNACKDDEPNTGVCRISQLAEVNFGVSMETNFAYDDDQIISISASAQLADGSVIEETGLLSYDDQERINLIRVSDSHYTEISYTDTSIVVTHVHPQFSLREKTYLLNEQNQIIELVGDFRYEYNDMGQMVSFTNINGSEPFVQFSAEYDNQPNPVAEILLTALPVAPPLVNEPFMTFTLLNDSDRGPNNLIKSTRFDEAGNILFETDFTYAYNEQGLPISFSSDNNSATFSYSCE